VKLRSPSQTGIPRERCLLYYCPVAGDFICAVPGHAGPEPCCDQREQHRHAPRGHCRNSPALELVDPPVSPSPDPYPDKVRIEFELPGRDLYAAWKDVESSLAAGWTPAESWLAYGETVPRTWDWMCWAWGYENLTTGVTVLIPAMTPVKGINAARAVQAKIDGKPWPPWSQEAQALFSTVTHDRDQQS
jgi:hypothetical protein